MIERWPLIPRPRKSSLGQPVVDERYAFERIGPGGSGPLPHEVQLIQQQCCVRIFSQFDPDVFEILRRQFVQSISQHQAITQPATSVRMIDDHMSEEMQAMVTRREPPKARHVPQGLDPGPGHASVLPHTSIEAQVNLDG
jgi:hypothetical protein